MTFFSRRPTN